MYFEVNSNESKWQNCLNNFDNVQKDIYFDYRYAKAYEKNGDGRVACAVFIGDNGMRLLYPFIIIKVPDYGLDLEYYDISSCYGYGGPLIDSYNLHDMNIFEIELHNWCLENNIVSEFIRYHPFLDNYDKFKKDIVVEKNRRTISVDLSASFKDIWEKSIASKNRNQIRKAEKSGVSIRESMNITDFMDIYKQTMEKLEADEYFYFSDSYFRELSKLIPQNMIILEAVYEEKVIAAAMFMFMGDKMHYHLAGSLREYLKFCPNNLIISNAIKYGIDNGYKYLHLGGGLSDSDEDSLFKFKKSFSSDIKEFYIGKRIHDNIVYEFLINKWEEKNKRAAMLFLQYEYE